MTEQAGQSDLEKKFAVLEERMNNLKEVHSSRIDALDKQLTDTTKETVGARGAQASVQWTLRTVTGAAATVVIIVFAAFYQIVGKTRADAERYGKEAAEKIAQEAVVAEAKRAVKDSIEQSDLSQASDNSKRIKASRIEAEADGTRIAKLKDELTKLIEHNDFEKRLNKLAASNLRCTMISLMVCNPDYVKEVLSQKETSYFDRNTALRRIMEKASSKAESEYQNTYVLHFVDMSRSYELELYQRTVDNQIAEIGPRFFLSDKHKPRTFGSEVVASFLVPESNQQTWASHGDWHLHYGFSGATTVPHLNRPDGKNRVIYRFRPKAELKEYYILNLIVLYKD